MRPSGKKRHHSIGDDWGLPRFAALGVGAMAGNVTSLALIIPAVKDIGDSPVGLGGQILALALVIVFALTPALVPLLLYSIMLQRDPTTALGTPPDLHGHPSKRTSSSRRGSRAASARR